MAKYKIILEGHGRGQVFKDGEAIEGVTAVTVHAGLDELTTIQLVLIADTVEVIAELPEDQPNG